MFYIPTLWQYGLSSFQAGCIKLERFLQKEIIDLWINGELSKTKMILSKNVNDKICAPELVFINENKIEKDWNDF